MLKVEVLAAPVRFSRHMKRVLVLSISQKTTHPLKVRGQEIVVGHVEGHRGCGLGCLLDGAVFLDGVVFLDEVVFLDVVFVVRITCSYISII